MHVLPSLISSIRSPFDHVFSRLSRHDVRSLAFGLQTGFCSRRMGISVAAFSAMDSKEEQVAKDLYNLASSEVNIFPTFPYGTLNEFDLQCTASA